MPRIDRYLRAAEGSEGVVRQKRLAVRTRVFIALIVGVVLWWWWPGLTGQGDETEVALFGTESLDDSRTDISRRLREEGFSVTWFETVRSRCDLNSELASATSMIVVLAPDDLDECERPFLGIIFELEDRGITERLVVIDLDGSGVVSAAMRSLLDAGAQRVATERLLGTIDEELPCVWWEDCAASGLTVTRTDTGLTPHGRDRLARLITAAVV